MAIPSGSGSEVLKRHAVKSSGANWTTIRWTEDVTASGNTSAGGEAVPTNVILTILNISMHNADGSNTLGFALTQDVAGTTDIYHLSNSAQAIPPNQTYIYNDRIILHPTDKLKVYGNYAYHCLINYIKQDWT
tara:strand:- start:22 stop:420 length:399 start_codon:yes stop_codon:yes gene_type:complete